MVYLKIALIMLLTGLAGLLIGIVARSTRIALGCATTGIMVAGGIAAALWIWGVIS